MKLLFIASTLKTVHALFFISKFFYQLENTDHTSCVSNDITHYRAATAYVRSFFQINSAIQ